MTSVADETQRTHFLGDDCPGGHLGESPDTASAERVMYENNPDPKSDRLYDAMFLQNMLQVAILGSKTFNQGMAPSVRESLAVSYLMGLFSETSEALKAIRFLPQWDRHQTDFDRLREEVVDVFHHVVNLAILLWGVDSDAFYRSYREKWDANFKRATENNTLCGRAAEQK